MILDFNAIPVTVLSRFKGGEKEVSASIFDDGLCRIMKGTLIPGASIGLHTHEGSCEVLFCLTGGAKAVYDGTEERILPGTAHYCPRDHSHTVVNDTGENMTFFTVIPQQR